MRAMITNRLASLRLVMLMVLKPAVRATAA